MSLTADWKQQDAELISQKTCQYKIPKLNIKFKEKKTDEIIRDIWDMH